MKCCLSINRMSARRNAQMCCFLCERLMRNWQEVGWGRRPAIPFFPAGVYDFNLYPPVIVHGGFQCEGGPRPSGVYNAP